MQSYDVCVVGGGGVIASAITRRLTLDGYKVVAVERHAGPAQETSGANSGVVHSGFHERPRTLKAILARVGSRELTGYAQEHGVPLLQCGMLIATPSALPASALFEEAGALWRLWRGGRKQEIS